MCLVGFGLKILLCVRLLLCFVWVWFGINMCCCLDVRKCRRVSCVIYEYDCS